MARQSQDVLTPEVIRQVGMIDPALAMKLEQDSFKRQGDRLKMLEDQNTMVAQVARGILQLDTQPGYEQGVAVLRRMGIPVDHLPAQYDRRMVEGYEAMLTDAVTQLQAGAGAARAGPGRAGAATGSPLAAAIRARCAPRRPGDHGRRAPAAHGRGDGAA